MNYNPQKKEWFLKLHRYFQRESYLIYDNDRRYLFLSIGNYLTCRYKEGLKNCHQIGDKELALKIELVFILKFRKEKIFSFIQKQTKIYQIMLIDFLYINGFLIKIG